MQLNCSCSSKQSCKRALFWSPNPARARHFFWSPIKARKPNLPSESI